MFSAFGLLSFAIVSLYKLVPTFRVLVVSSFGFVSAFRHFLLRLFLSLRSGINNWVLVISTFVFVYRFGFFYFAIVSLFKIRYQQLACRQFRHLDLFLRLDSFLLQPFLYQQFRHSDLFRCFDVWIPFFCNCLSLQSRIKN